MHPDHHGITLARACADWRHGGGLPERPVVISFDDGYRSNSTTAEPVLRKLGWPGVLSLELDNPGPSGISLSRLRGLGRRRLGDRLAHRRPPRFHHVRTRGVA